MADIKSTPGLPPTARASWTIGRSELAESLHREIGLTHKDAASLVDAVLEEISVALIEGDTVKLSGFGVFRVNRKKQRMGRNPATGEAAPISARKVLVFRAGSVLKDRINHRPRARQRLPRDTR